MSKNLNEKPTVNRTVLLPNGGIAPGPHHIHPAYVVLNAISIVLSLLIIGSMSIFGSLVALITSDDTLASIGILGVVVVSFVALVIASVVIAYIYYKRFLWEITEAEIHIYSGIVFKKQVHIPFQRVQSIDFKATLLERILGLVKLKIETAGGASNTGVVIPALKLAQAEALRADVFARKQYSVRQQEAAMQEKMRMARVAQGVQAPVTAGGAGAAGAVAGVAGVAAGAVAGGGGAVAGAPRFDPQTGQPLAPASPAVARFDPQTGEPLPWAAPLPGAALGAAGAAPGIPGTVAGTPLGAADSLVDTLGSEIGGIRGVFAEDFREDAPIEYEYGLTAKELLLSALSSDHHLVLLPVLLGLVPFAIETITVLGYEEVAQGALTTAFSSSFLPIIILGCLATFIFLLVLGVIGTAVSYGGFKARRRGGRIEVERGLLSRQYKGVSITRVQSVEIRQGFIRKLIGYAELKLLTIDSMDTSGNQQNGQALASMGLIVHPFVKLDRVEAILEHLAPEFNGRPAQSEMQQLPKVALRRSLTRTGIVPTLLYLVCALAITVPLIVFEVQSSIQTPVLIGVWAVVALLVVLHIIGAILWYRHAGYAYNASMLTVRQGFYGQVTTVIPRRKIQWAKTRENPFQRLSRVATITAVTAAGVSGTSTRLRDLTREEADAYLDWVRPKAR